MKRILIIPFLLIVFFLSASSKPFQPVNSKASSEAKALLAYLYSLQGKSTLSAQHNYPSVKEYTRSTDSIVAMTGKVPAIWGTDISELDQSLVDEAIRQYHKGCIITLMYHQVKPFDHDSMGFSRSVKGMVTDAQWKEIVTPGTKFHQQWLAKIDARAEVLKKLRDAHIPVLWRPYHEMNGMWFWYGNRPGKEGIQKLWKIMYDRYTNFHHLDNLIWVWNTNAPRDWKDDQAYAYELFYPGAKYVDILAADVYKNDFKQSHHDQLVKLGKGKLIALGEVGNLPRPEILEQQPQWSWFMCWAHFPWDYNTHEQVKSLYNSPRVMTLDEVKRK